MKIEIWSDIMCPFCYIGKRKFETALSQFPHANDVEIIWKSFQLAPDMVTDTSKNIHQFLATHKGMPIEQAKDLNNHVTELAKNVGLVYDFDKAIPANSLKAHQFSHLALQFGLQLEAEEALFKAYFTDGKNIDDIDTLVAIGESIGLDQNETRKALETNEFANEVQNDIYEAQQIGVRGVPFFVFDRKMAVSGAQDSSVFLETLEKSFDDWRKQKAFQPLNIINGESCDVDGNCD